MKSIISVHEIRTEDIGIVASKVMHLEEKQPFMVAFFKSAHGGITVRPRSRRIRETTKSRKRKSMTETSNYRNPYTGFSGNLIFVTYLVFITNVIFASHFMRGEQGRNNFFLAVSS